MKMVWNRELKKLGAAFAAVSLATFLLCNLAFWRYRAESDREYQAVLASLVGSVQDAYPEASVEDVVAVLNGQDPDDGQGQKFLRRYGAFLEDDIVVFEGARRKMQAFRRRMNLTLAVFMGGLFFYLAGRQKRLRDLCGYMEELVRGNYKLEIRGNADDELSGLKNEVYKLTVFFREQAERAAENRRALADSVADISHQLKTPLTSVTVLVDDLADNEDMDADTRRSFLTEISRQLAGVSWLTAVMLKLSRLDAGVVELEKEPLRVADLMEEVCGRLELTAELRQVEFSRDIAEDLQISGDSQWLTEAFLNVVKNAVEHSEAGGKVEISASRNEVYTMVTVRNRGKVISEEDRKHLFERFYRGASAGKDSVGIGLALTKEILNRQDGSISVESDRERGTIFFIKFFKCH